MIGGGIASTSGATLIFICGSTFSQGRKSVGFISGLPGPDASGGLIGFSMGGIVPLERLISLSSSKFFFFVPPSYSQAYPSSIICSFSE